jgi:phage-related minor tail protein
MMETLDIDHALAASKELRGVFEDLESRSRAFGSAVTTALEGAVLDGHGLADVLRDIATRFSAIALDAGLQPLQNSLTSVFSSLTGALAGSLSTPGGSATATAAQASPASAQNAATQVYFNVQATDAESFRRSESQINTMLTRAVGRGRRGL